MHRLLKRRDFAERALLISILILLVLAIAHTLRKWARIQSISPGKVELPGVGVVTWRAVAPCVRPLSEWRVAQRR